MTRSTTATSEDSKAVVIPSGDKASHFVSYYVVSKELTNLYQRLGHSERAYSGSGSAWPPRPGS